MSEFLLEITEELRLVLLLTIRDELNSTYIYIYLDFLVELILTVLI